MKFFILGLIIAVPAFAETPSVELETKTNEFSDVLESQESKKSLSLTTIRIRTSLDAGVEIPGVTNAIVSPEIEIFFTK